MNDLIKKSFSVLGVVDEDLEKAHLINTFERGDNIKIKKKGSEVKEKLTDIRKEEEKESQDYFSKVLGYRSKISQPPTEDAPEWYLQNLKMPKEKVPKIYSYQVMYPSDSDTIQTETSGRSPLVAPESVKILSQEEAVYAEKYNECLRKYFGCLKEVSYIDTFLNNLEENKTYDLSMEQANAFGF